MSGPLSIKTSARCPECNRRLHAEPHVEHQHPLNDFFPGIRLGESGRSERTVQFKLTCKGSTCPFNFVLSMGHSPGGNDGGRFPNMNALRQEVYDSICALAKVPVESKQSERLLA